MTDQVPGAGLVPDAILPMRRPASTRLDSPSMADRIAEFFLTCKLGREAPRLMVRGHPENV
jgi:hypothetical protein